MNALSLRTKLIVASCLVFFVLSGASSAILYNAQSRQAAAEMDTVLTNEILALSALVNSRPGGRFDFEISDSFVDQYGKLKPGSFFLFIEPEKGTVLFKSPHAPLGSCDKLKDGKSSVVRLNHARIRFRTSFFLPQIDSDWKGPGEFSRNPLCLVVGLDEAPFRAVIFNTLVTTIPLLLFLFGLLTTVVLILAQRIVKDLSALAKTIETADFSATHEFPDFPVAATIEVKAVAEKLRELHHQASDVYKEMWLFLGRAAHQIKTPVAAMQATLDVLLRKDRTKEELISGLSDVQLAAGSLTNLTKKLIASSRVAYLSEPKISLIHLSSFFKQQATSFSALALSREVSLELEGDDSLEIKSDPDLLSEIFGNLIENAILYSPVDGNSVVRIHWWPEGPNIKFLIANSGPGIPDHVKNALGSPFVRGDERQVSGSGLGLSIVHRATILLSGSLKIDSAEDQTKLVVTIPRILNR